MKDFLKVAFKQFGALCLAYLAFSVLLLILFLGFGVIFGRQKVDVKDDSVLVFDLSLNISDAPGSHSPWRYLEQPYSGSPSHQLNLKAALDAIDRAGGDDRISALFLHGSLKPFNYGSNFANLIELREAILRFREQGKPVVAYLVGPTIRDYYLSSAAESIILNPFGFLRINGLAANLLFLGNAFEKYGIGVQIFQAGKYKSYGEVFTRDRMSDENRRQTSVWLEGIWSTILGDIAKDRKIARETLGELTDEYGIFQAKQAVQFGLVDRLAYFDEVLEELSELGPLEEDAEGFAQIEMSQYSREENSIFSKISGDGKQKVAVVYLEGEIVDGEGEHDQVGGNRFARILRRLRNDDKVKAVVLRVNSPGGSVIATETIEREVRLLKSEKPVVVSMGGYAASGGYWISAYADTIFAESATITGSIGVFGIAPNVKEIANAHGVTFDGVKTSPFADIFSITRPKTSREMELFQDFTEFIYEQFLTRVEKGRDLSRLEVEQIAQGRVWTGADALKVGLVDKIGGLGAAIKEAAELGGLKEDWGIVEVPEPADLSKWLAVIFGGGKRPPLIQESESLVERLLRVERELPFLRVLNDPNGVYARLPFLMLPDLAF